ncbi:MAG: DUF4128 domain-containing protein [Rhizobiaceae bacterium]|nr:DUF4128 domain-containing protein [Rhizobiaceae bacterium]
MSSPAAFTGIETYLRTNWTATPIHFENEPWNLAASPAHFLYVEMFGDFYDQASIGADPQDANLFRENGQVYVHVMTLRGIGTGQARTYAKQIVDLFRGNEEAGVRPRGMSIGASEPGEQDGNYFRLTVTIDWERDD